MANSPKPLGGSSAITAGGIPSFQTAARSIRSFSDDMNRYANILRSDDLLLLRVGAKRVYFDSKEDILLELLAQQLRANYARRDVSDDERVDSIAWMAKALGSSRNDKYTALLRESQARLTRRRFEGMRRRPFRNTTA